MTDRDDEKPADGGKRLFDVTLATALLLPALLACLVFGVLIRLIDGSSPLFRQERVGRFGRPFQLYKLRTMRPDSPNLPTHESSTSHVTPLGRFLRRTKADELPQLVNVLRGDMSFVGPRPCLPGQIELIDRRDELGVSALRPGITGVSQIAGLDMSRPAELAIRDALYRRRWSLRADLAILARTFLGGGSGDALFSADAHPGPRNAQDK
jgi:lipopolysaccharide/colanic/teichoic acid biosynthesis glycosyltransferase